MKIVLIALLSVVVLASCQTSPERKKQIVRTSMCAPRGVDALAELDQPVPLFEGLGEQNFPVTTSAKKAQAYFVQGFQFTVAFNHMEAVRSFRQALKYDPQCAMAHWGVAFALGPNYNAAFDPSVLAIVNESLENARRLADACTEKERDLILALSERYPKEVDEDQPKYEAAYAEALRRLAKKYPADANMQALLAEALMNLHPWDLWERDGRPKPWTPEILGTIERNLERHPDHIATIHLYIHATEASQTPELARPWAAKLPDLAPGAGHLVHMPSHTYIRTGDYHEGTIANAKAVAVDSNYLEACHAAGIYPLAYYPHNFHFLAACAAFEGDSETAIDASRRMVGKLDTMAMRQAGYETIQHYYSIPYNVLAKFSRWNDILALPRPARDLMYPTAIWRYARGMALLNKGRPAEAQQELTNLQLLAKEPGLRELTIWEINKMGDLLDIAAFVLEGELAAERGDLATAKQLLEKAVAIEDNLSYNEPPDWFFSVRHHLGPVLLEMGLFAEAEAMYREDLKTFRKNGFALNGLYLALMKQGKTTEAAEIRSQFEKAWQYADVTLEASRVAS